MPAKRLFDRASYESDSEFEHFVDEVAGALGTTGKRELMFSLMRQCRGCGNVAAYESTEHTVRVDKQRGVFQRQMECKACGHAIPIKINECHSIGRLVTLWNTTPLTIESAHV
ncbi:hypothetical protein HZF02_32665 (plasmid) [Pseudomonas yamanorum]|nr:hypothetical protein HZF02_32665 [Pseudomonas yamanorum]